MCNIDGAHKEPNHRRFTTAFKPNPVVGPNINSGCIRICAVMAATSCMITACNRKIAALAAKSVPFRLKHTQNPLISNKLILVQFKTCDLK